MKITVQGGYGLVYKQSVRNPSVWTNGCLQGIGVCFQLRYDGRHYMESSSWSQEYKLVMRGNQESAGFCG